MSAKLFRLHKKNPKRVIGLMSGTSMDGIDACLTEIYGNGISTKVKILAFETYPYDKATRNAVLGACNPETGTVDKICRLNFSLGKLFAGAAKAVAGKAGISLSEIDLIGSHGQTIYHLPQPASQSISDISSMLYAEEDILHDSSVLYKQNYGSTLQIGEPAVIAHDTGITTVADFRPGDMAAGGQGAPLISYLDFVLFRSKEKGRVLQNIGGIANVTFLPRSCDIHDVRAFDTGPGNMIIDRITELITENAHHYDEGGKRAAKGKVIEGLLTTLLSHPFLSKPPPKSTGREEFGKQFADTVFHDAIHSGMRDVDILTTVTAFTAHTIADSYKQWILPEHDISEVILSGGGVYNATLLSFLRAYLSPRIELHSIEKYGIKPNEKEALAFAVLANETVSGNPNNIPGATGASEPVILGKVVLGK